MERFDAVIVGGATAGSYLARKLSEAGRSVLVLEAKPEEGVGGRYDIFHIARPAFQRFGLPEPAPGEDFAFEYTGGAACSAFGRHPKRSFGTTVGMHMHPYTLRLNRWAMESGAKFLYGTAFEDFLYDGAGRIAGVVCVKDGERMELGARLVADCSGIPSAARRKLPEGYGVENFEITPDEMFYVTLRYVKYAREEDYVRHIRSWTFYKTWEAPEADPEGAILGVGANLGFEVGERVFAAFEKAVELPPYAVKRIERGTTPYRRPPYSFVADGFLVSGDAACLTKPSAGEGVTAAMVQLEIAAERVNELLARPAYLSREALWPINKRYIDAQGKSFASQLATLVGAVATSAEENDFFFEKDVIFSAKTFQGLGAGETLRFSPGELLRMGFKMLGGVLGGRLRVSTIRSLLQSMSNGGRIAELYAAFPETPAGF
ncbi:MAG: NAD(P)/FAD-dependent oxidoreductase, partial [Clostridia bacterium]|nr:NAD(P)/FAD-dependent oxidoreductase [Clostridia bacterium]